MFGEIGNRQVVVALRKHGVRHEAEMAAEQQEQAANRSPRRRKMT
jgi:hypothetical protein